MPKLSVRDFYSLQFDPFEGCAAVGPGCWLVECRGFFLLTTRDNVEIVGGEDDLAILVAEWNRRFTDYGRNWNDYIRPPFDWRNDPFGSRRRAPTHSRDEARHWARSQMAAGEPTKYVVAALEAAGMFAEHARESAALGMWDLAHANPPQSRSELLPLISDIERIEFERLGPTEIDHSDVSAKEAPMSDTVGQVRVVAVVATVASALGLADLPYGYYILIRLLLCGSSLFLAFGARQQLEGWHRWALISFALVYNPLLPVTIGAKVVWEGLNVATVALFWVLAFRSSTRVHVAHISRVQ
jgi:hypothetical protein